MKKLFLLLMSLFFISNLFAQTAKKDGLIVDKKAEEIINKVASTLKAESPISLSFSFLEEGVKTKTQNGSLSFNGDKFFGELLNNKIYSDGKSVWIYQIKTKEVTINDIDDVDNNLLNVSKLIADANKKFRPKLIKEEKGNYIIDLLPKIKSEFSKIRLSINKETRRICKVDIKYKTSNQYVYTITNYKIKQPLKDIDFIFPSKDYPNTIITDLR